MNTQIVTPSEPTTSNQSMTAMDARSRQQRRDSQAREQAIEALVRENHIDIEQVRQLYDTEHAKLEAHATIKTFVSLITMRIVRAALQQETSRLQ